MLPDPQKIASFLEGYKKDYFQVITVIEKLLAYDPRVRKSEGDVGELIKLLNDIETTQPEDDAIYKGYRTSHHDEFKS
jgi:hypothetical protein